MTLPYTLDIGSSYLFAFRAQAILGEGLDSATVQALLDYEEAQKIQDVDGIHASVLALLPAGTPADPSKLIYVKVKSGDNQSRVYAMDWIAQQPTLVSTTSVTVIVANCPPNRRAVLSSALRANGFNEFTIS
jgi:hypothetical protein